MPKVTVIVPNYNHARYLPRRLDSILGQDFGDIEVLFFDDASPDHSRAVFEAHAASSDRRVRAIFNERNSGSTFVQWNRGFREAKGEYLWIAESDDFAEASLLSELVLRLDAHPRVGLAYCESWIVDQDDVIISLASTVHAGAFEPERWKTDFVNDGREECRRYLIRGNTVPNASAVLLRKSIVDRVGPVPEDVKLAGDWLMWVRMLRVSDVAFVARPLNYFRTHGATVRSRTVQGGVWMENTFRVWNTIAREADVSRAHRAEIARSLAWTWWASLGKDHGAPAPWGTHFRIFRQILAMDPWVAPTLAFATAHKALGRSGLLGVARTVKRSVSRGERVAVPAGERTSS
jgi:cellulose synthase/poly-beta-1,6-N-acetylglucosamine synthase-like glycosyltransferase